MEKKYSFRKGSEYFRIFLNNSFLYSHFYIEKRDSLEDFLRDREYSVNSSIRNLSKKFKFNQEDITSIKEFHFSLFPRISESAYSYIKKRAFLVFTYSEMEQYFFKCMKHILISHSSYSEVKAEKQTVGFIMRNNWQKIFNSFRAFINHTINDNLIKELDKFRIIRNLFAHGNGTINQNYLNYFPNSSQRFGDRLDLTTDLIYKYQNLSSEIIIFFDDALLQIFPELTYNP